MLNNIHISKGIKLAFITAIISGLAVFFNKFAVTESINPYQFTALKNIIVAVFLSLLVITPLIFKKIRSVQKEDWIKLFGIGVIGGSLPFILFFKGLSMTSAVTAGFIHKTLFIWVAIFAVIFLKEKITKLQYIALGVLLMGTVFLGGATQLKFGLAELMILMATLLWSVENIIAKKVLKNVDAKIVAWARMFFGSIILLGFVATQPGFGELFTLSLFQWGWIVLSVVLLTAYVLTWYHALKYEKAATVASILVIASPITTLLNSLYTGNILSILKLAGILLSIIGVILFIYLGRKLCSESEEKNASTI